MKSEMSSAQRIKAVVMREDFDHLPLCFEGIYHSVINFLKERMPDQVQRCDYYLSLGLDTAMQLSPEALDYEALDVADGVDQPAGERYPVMHREYRTPVGVLRQSVRQTEDYGTTVSGPGAGKIHVRLLTDHNVPASRSIEYLISRPDQLPALEHILRPISGAKKDDYLRLAQDLKKQCQQRGVLFAGYSQGVGDPLMWMSGVENILIWSIEQPDFLRDYAAVVARWNLENLKLMAEAGCEYVVRRGWYESADFWSPDLYDKFLLPHLRAETDFAHGNGMLYAYCMNSGSNPLLDCLLRSGIDVLCNIDPLASMTDLGFIKQRIGDSITLCGGVNNQHVIAKGSPQEVREAVEQAVAALAGGGGYILSPGDSLLECTETTEKNFHAMIDAWRELCI